MEKSKNKSLKKMLLTGGAAIMLIAPLALSPIASKVVPNTTITVQAKRRHHKHYSKHALKVLRYRAEHPKESLRKAEHRATHIHKHKRTHSHKRHHSNLMKKMARAIRRLERKDRRHLTKKERRHLCHLRHLRHKAELGDRARL